MLMFPLLILTCSSRIYTVFSECCCDATSNGIEHQFE